MLPIQTPPTRYDADRDLGVFGERSHFKPIRYEWAFKAYQMQQKMHWLPAEIPLHEDVRDWNDRLTNDERNLLTQIFRFFTQGDIDVSEGYVDRYLARFKLPELRMMMLAFANMEAVHIEAYSLLLEEVGMPEVEYQAFRQIKEMAAKHEFVTARPMIVEGFTDNQAAALDIAVFSAFTEGLHLFSSFAILLNFTRFGKMKGMGQIVTWSVRDESLHVESMVRLFRAVIEENPHLWTQTFIDALAEICRRMVELEDDFVDLAFGLGQIEGLNAADVKSYVRFIADRRMAQLGALPLYGVTRNPLPWLADMLSAVEHANFFETRATEYAKASATGSWSKDVWGALQPGANPEPEA